MKTIRLALLPFSFLYGLAVWLRNRFYDWAWLQQRVSAKAFTVVVGNLEIGGTGKSPMIELLIRKCQEKGLRVATLSRGYGRKTKGFKWVTIDSTSESVGDEPLQFKKKFPEIGVAVCEDRWLGVLQLEENYDLILLDDAFQHRALRPHFSILLFDFNTFFEPKFLLPAGNFRDHWSERKRADAWVVTKCPPQAENSLLDKIRKRLSGDLVVPGQSESRTFFTEIQYLEGVRGTNPREFMDLDTVRLDSILLVTGIARPAPLLAYLKARFAAVEHIAFPDHYAFKTSDFEVMEEKFNTLTGQDKILITTEKDAQRIWTAASAAFSDLPWYYLPIRTAFRNPEDADKLFQQIYARYEIFKKATE